MLITTKNKNQIFHDCLSNSDFFISVIVKRNITIWRARVQYFYTGKKVKKKEFVFINILNISQRRTDDKTL
jgi:hypothetical protein